MGPTVIRHGEAVEVVLMPSTSASNQEDMEEGKVASLLSLLGFPLGIFS